MSTLNVTNISDGTNTTSTTDVVKGSAKAWVNFDGRTNTGGNCDIRESYNVSSVTDEGVGYYTINLTTAMPDTNYSVIVASGDNTPNTSRTDLATGGPVSTSAFYYVCFTNANVDTEVAQAAVFR